MPSLHHVNLVVPPGRSDAIATFYTEVFQLVRIQRPANGRTGVWLDAGGTQIHLSERSGEREAQSDAHVALVVDDLAAVKVRLAAVGAEFKAADDVFGTGGRGFTRDPAGNRLELINRG